MNILYLQTDNRAEQYCCQGTYIIIGVGTGGARGAMAPTEFQKCVLAPPVYTDSKLS